MTDAKKFNEESYKSEVILESIAKQLEELNKKLIGRGVQIL